MDMTETIAPKSDQLNADDLIAGPRNVTVEKVTPGTPEQPVEIHLLEFPGRPFKPSKTVRRILVAAWGPDADAYSGRRMTLYRDATVRFGGQDVGGIRISHMSHIDKRMTLALTVTRGKRSPYVVEPLADAVPASPVVSAETLDALYGLFASKGIPEDAQLAGVNRITGGAATGLEVITEQEAQQVIEALRARPDVQAPDPYDGPMFPQESDES